MAFHGPQRVRGGSGRGRGSFRGRPPFTPSVPSLLSPSASQHWLHTITVSSLEEVSVEKRFLKIEDVQYVASYNWLGRDTNTILVPGKPPKWLPPVHKQQLQEDRGQYYRDRNSVNYPSHPIEPAIYATYEVHPDFDPTGIDIVACGSTIGSLLSFARGEERVFRFGVERIGSTIFLVRKTNTPNEVIENVRGYGHSFPEAYTTWEPEVKASSSHQRIIRYDFAGLSFLVRSESDGYLPSKAAIESADKHEAHALGETQLHAETISTLDDDVSLNNALSIFSQTYVPQKHAGRLKIRKAGHPVPQNAIFDLKTRSVRRKDEINMAEFLPRLWATQTPNFVLAWHTSGVFHKIEVKDVQSNLQNWERDNQATLSKFQVILKVLISMSRTTTRFEIRREEVQTLEVWSEVKDWSALSTKVKKMWLSEADETLEMYVSASDTEGDEDDDYLRF